MTAAWLWARSELRTRWRSWLVLGLLTGATFGLAAAGVAGARRSSVAVPRYIAVGHVPDAAVLANNPSFDPAQRAEVARLPEIRAVYPFDVAFGLVFHGAEDSGGLVPVTAATTETMVGVLLEGRMPNPSRPDEAVIDQNARNHYKLDIGSTITLSQSVPPEQIAQAPPGFIPKGVDLDFSQRVRVVGIAKSVGTDMSTIPSSGFYAKYGPRLVGFVNMFASLRHGDADFTRFQQGVEHVVGHPINVERFADLVGIQKVSDVIDVERDGLLLFALAVIIGGGVLVGQALAPAVTAGAGELATWRAIGADRSIAMRALILPTAVTAGVAAITSFAVAIALSARFPIGLARRFDLDVGSHADWTVLAVAAVAVVVVVIAIAAVAALFAVTRRQRTSLPPSRIGASLARAGLPPALVIGSRLAVEPGRGRRAVPVRSALVGAIVGVMGVVACFTFRAGLGDAVASPQRSGVVWNYLVATGEGSLSSHDLHTIVADRNVGAAMHAVWDRAVRINGVSTPTFGVTRLKGNMNPVVLHGRAPRARDEMAIAPVTMQALKLHIGDHAVVGAHDLRVHVVGEALLPASSHTDYDQSAWMTGAGLHAVLPPADQLSPDEFEDYVFIRWAPDARVAAAEHRYAGLHHGDDAWFTSRAELPGAVTELGRLRSLPLALAVFFALLGCATVAHALVTTVRRRRGDLAVLRSFGFTRRQSRIAIAWQATLLAIAGLILGVPVGIVGGRVIWRWLAHSFPVVYVPPIAILAIVVVIPVAVALANLLAAWPARSAARIRPAEALRAE